MVVLKISKLFSGMLAAELQALEQTAQLRAVPAGRHIFQEGDPGDGLYIIVDGTVQISCLVEPNQRRILSSLGPGDFFGTRQSGLPTLRVGDLLRDHELLEIARREAAAALDDPQQAAALTAMVSASWEQRFGLVGVG